MRFFGCCFVFEVGMGWRQRLSTLGRNMRTISDCGQMYNQMGALFWEAVELSGGGTWQAGDHYFPEENTKLLVSAAVFQSPELQWSSQP